MPVRMPSPKEIRDAGQRFNFEVNDEEVDGFSQIIREALPAYRRLDELVAPTVPVKYPRRDFGARPSTEENRYNGWAWRCSIPGAAEGPLAGKKVGLKDHVRVAGIPMMNSSSVMEGYVPTEDATIVTRLLDAGAEIIGKAVNGSHCFDAIGLSIYPGPQPINPATGRHCAGGSSNGSAVVVANGDADITMGGDQGGSIRIPASWCGIVGHKPTFGLVPHTGLAGLDHSIDYTGPMAKTVRDCALALQAVAGADGLDPRQSDIRVDDYTAHLEDGVDGLRIGILAEGFGHPESMPAVDDATREAAGVLERAGATLVDVSVPMHLDGNAILWPLMLQGGNETNKQDGSGHGWRGHYALDHVNFMHRTLKARSNDLPLGLKLVLLLGEYTYSRYGMHYYAKAQNLSRALRAAYDEVLTDVDVLLMPTLPFTAPPLPEEELSTYGFLSVFANMIHNTGSFNPTGHPALTVPCGTHEGLPIGMQLVGRHFDDGLLLRTGCAYEQR
jgi:amidase